MAQYARPNDDVDTGWSYSTGSTLYECIDEVTPNDSDYIYTDTETTCQIGLATVTDPQVGTGHTCRWRWKSVGGVPPQRGTIRLYQAGTTLRATLADNLTVGTSWEDGDYTLSEGEANAITDYSDLSVRFQATALGSSEELAVSWFELEVPDAPAPGGAASNLALMGVG
jgi:hypothetical protein